ncbi:MAG: 1-acyl-sn-glycerol-3-phosphate acyltransferase, partial [Candidatus Poseidoniales archaeon]
MEAGEESRAQDSPLPFSYRLVRRFYRFLTGVWFREVNVVDDEHLPPEGGRLYITWHPSGLIDPMLMTAVLPGQLTTVAKHTLFRVPFLGRLLKLSGVVPVERANDTSDPDGARQRNAERLAGLASGLARGKDVLIFPEGSTHSDSGVRRVRSGAARILLAALREADAAGFPRPHVVPVGLHYSETERFRERAAVVIERTMALPDLPSLGQDGEAQDGEAQDRLDRAW